MDTTLNESDNVELVTQVSSFAEFVKWVDKTRRQNMLFRGLANTDWEVESSLYRRLIFNGFEDVESNTFLEMTKILINDARLNGHDIRNGRKLEDLELLVDLQHNGAATCLIDFTKNSLVALYFACTLVDNDDSKADGKVVAFNSDNAEYDEISIKDLDEEIKYWFEKDKNLWILSPRRIGNRIISQQSMFVFGSPTLPAEKFRICRITNANKKEIMKELKTYGISAEILFDDFVGFSTQNSYNKEYKSWNTENNFMSGILYSLSGEHKSAIKCYDKEINSNPEFSAASYYNRGIAKHHLGKFQDALSDYDEAIRLNSKSSQAYNNRGNSKSELKEYQDAINDYDEAIRLNPKYSLAYNNRGNSKSELKEYQDAINDYDEAIRLNPKYSLAYNNRGNSKSELKEYQDAINDYDEAIRLNPKYSEAHYNRGITKYELNKFEEAISDYDEVIRLDPKYLAAYNNRGFVKIRLGKFQDALSDLDEAIRLNPQYSKAYNNRGIAKNKLGKFQDALSDLDEAIKLNPQYSKAYYNRGFAKIRLNDKEGAAVDFAKSKE